MTTLLVATRNAHKVGEIAQILGENFRCLTLDDFPGAPSAIEDAETFAGNAQKKVLCLADWLKANPPAEKTPSFILADDSGLEVDALGGQPGVHSARFAAVDAGNAPDSANNAKLLRLLEGTPAERRTARFRCVLALFYHGEIVLFDGVCEGKILFAPSGRGGFGYDPLFVPQGCPQSFADLGDEVKNQLSHRARALEQLKQFLQQRSLNPDQP